MRFDPLRTVHRESGHLSVGPFLSLESEECQKPQPPLLLRKVSQYTSHLYCSTPPICIAVLLEKFALRKGKYCRYSSHLYRSTPPICIAVRLPFVLQYFWENLGGCRHWHVPHGSVLKNPEIGCQVERGTVRISTDKLGKLHKRGRQQMLIDLRVCWPAREPRTEKSPKVLPECSRECSQKSGCSRKCSRERSRGSSHCTEQQEEHPREHSREHSREHPDF